MSLLIGLGLTACSGHGGASGFSAPPSTSTSAPPPTGTQAPPRRAPPTTPPASTARIFTRTFVADSALIKTSDVPAGASWFVERAFPALHFVRPVYLTNAGDGSGRVFVCELRGVVWALSAGSSGAPVTSSVFLDISKQVHYGTEEGLFSIAFHPRFAQNGLAFVAYTTGTSYTAGAPDQVRVRVSRFQLLAGNPGALDPSSEQILFEIPKKYKNHNGGQVAFGPDGYLYVSFGDGGCCGDPERNAQNLGALKGKILRVDVDAGSPYGIPSDNPFVATPGARPEVWAYGLRNPWRFSFDRATGRLWAGDVGQDTWEEVDVITKGANLGWPATEGDHVFDGTVQAPGSIAPAIEYDHTIGQCVIGGYVYQGSRVPGLKGAYLFADYGTGQVWAARYDGIRVTANTPVANTVAPAICSFGEDEQGEVYLLSYSTGSVYKVSAAPGATTFPQTLSATGLFQDLPTQTMRSGMLPYAVTEPLWSDHALKTRHMLLPHLDTVAFTASDGWGFPADTILAKHFYLEQTRGDPRTKKIMETRLLVKTQGEWYGYTYEWNDLGTDAALLGESKHRSVGVVVSGTATLQDWYYPARSECLSCHTAAAGFVLGPQAAQLNAPFDYTALGGKVENQLAALDRIGVFTNRLGAAPSAFPKLVAHTDTTATIDARARSYLHVNCAHCHRPGGGTPYDLDLRFDTPLDQMNVVGMTPQGGDFGVAGAAIVKKNDPNLSVLYLRLTNLGSLHMPPLASQVVDDEGAQLIGDWIKQLP